MGVRVEQGPLLIADLSGYTHYMASVDLEASHVVCELLDTVATSLEPFEVAKLEGDAVFCRAPHGAISGTGTLDRITEAYCRFVEHAGRINTQSGCRCPACGLLPGLGLKFVLHHGEYAVHEIAGSTELVGPEVILVHRLLKNAVGTQWGHRDYVLATEQWAQRTGVELDVLGGERHAEAYEHIGEVRCVVLNLATTADDVPVLEPRLSDARRSRCTYPGAVVFRTTSAPDADA